MSLKPTTLVFLVKRDRYNAVSDVCLAMKKRGFGMGRFNGVGGKVEAEETVDQAAIREAKEEVGVDCNGLHKSAELTFLFPAKPEWDQLVTVYLCESWTGEPVESDEMRPQWFAIDAIPYVDMWPDDPFWLPLVLAGKEVKATFSFGENDQILSKEIA